MVSYQENRLGMAKFLNRISPLCTVLHREGISVHCCRATRLTFTLSLDAISCRGVRL